MCLIGQAGNGWRMRDDGWQGTDDRLQKTGDGRRKIDDGWQMTDDGWWMMDDGWRMMEDRGRMTDCRRQGTEDGRSMLQCSKLKAQSKWGWSEFQLSGGNWEWGIWNGAKNKAEGWKLKASRMGAQREWGRGKGGMKQREAGRLGGWEAWRARR